MVLFDCTVKKKLNKYYSRYQIKSDPIRSSHRINSGSIKYNYFSSLNNCSSGNLVCYRDTIRLLKQPSPTSTVLLHNILVHNSGKQ